MNIDVWNDQYASSLKQIGHRISWAVTVLRLFPLLHVKRVAALLPRLYR